MVLQVDLYEYTCPARPPHMSVTVEWVPTLSMWRAYGTGAFAGQSVRNTGQSKLCYFSLQLWKIPRGPAQVLFNPLVCIHRDPLEEPCLQVSNLSI